MQWDIFLDASVRVQPACQSLPSSTEDKAGYSEKELASGIWQIINGPTWMDPAWIGHSVPLQDPISQSHWVCLKQNVWLLPRYTHHSTVESCFVLLFTLLTKGNQYALLLFWVANDSSKRKIFVIHCSHNLPTLFNLLYLNSMWYNFLNENHRRKNKNKALGHVWDSFAVPPASFQLQGHNASGDIAGINKHQRCWTLPYQNICSSDVLTWILTASQNPILKACPQCSVAWRWLDQGFHLLTKWICLWIDSLRVYTVGTVRKPSTLCADWALWGE